MQPRLPAVVLCAWAASVGSAHALDVRTPPGWAEAVRNDEIVIFYKEDEKVHARAFQACGEMDATPESVFKVVTDFEAHPKFMPYTKESKIVRRLSATEIIGYQLISPPVVSERDYYMHVKVTPGSPATGGVYKSEWNLVPDYMADRAGVIRMPVAEGFWLFEPIDGGKRSRVTYTSVTCLGGSIPDWLANRSNLNIIPKIFKAVMARLGK